VAGAELQSAIRGLGIGVGLIALFLGLRLRLDRQGREGPLSDVDRVFHARQDVRRRLGVAVLATIAGLMELGYWVEPGARGRGNPVFVVLWLGILALIAGLLGVALWDSAATWRYGRDRRRELVRDHVRELRRHAPLERAETDEPPASDSAEIR